MRRVLALIICLTGCGDNVDSRVVLAAGPMVVVGEGSRLEIPVTIEPAPDSIVVPSTFVVEADGLDDQFAELTIEMGTAGPVLVARPLCSMVRPGEGSALVSLLVRTEPTNLATAASVTLQVIPGDVEACAPLVRTWLAGDPSSPCDRTDSGRTIGSRLDLPIGASPPLCIEVISLDPELEHLYLRSDTDAPNTLFAPPSADDFVRQIFEIPIGDTDDFRGEFQLRHRVYLGDPGQAGELATDGTTTLVIGQPGQIALELLSDRIDAAEFDVGVLNFRVWFYPTSEQEDIFCVSSYRSTDNSIAAVSRTKPFLRVIDATGGSALEGEWLCGDGVFTLRVSPPIEAQAIETIVLDARGCGVMGCSGNGIGESVIQREVEIDVTSVAEELICGSLPGTAQPLVACADIFGDPTPEVFMLTTGGQACAFLGSDQRFGGPLAANDPAGTAFGLDPIDQPSEEQLEAPLTVRAFEWFDDEALVTVPVVLGRFAAEPLIRRLEIRDKTNGNGQTVNWLAAPEMQFLDSDDIPLEEAQPVSSDKNLGASHLAFFERVGSPLPTWTLRLRCISSKSANGLAPCVDASLDFGQPAVELAGFTAADIDGDGDRDLVYFITTGSGPLLDVFLIELDWTTPGQPVIGSVVVVTPSLQLLGDEVVATAAPGANGPEDVYMVSDPDFPVANLVHIRGKSDAFVFPPVADILATPGPALGVVGTNAGLIVALQLGTWELTRDMMGVPLWTLADPVLQENADVGSLTTPPDGYGRALARCIADPEAIMFTSDQRTARYTQLDLVVTDP